MQALASGFDQVAAAADIGERRARIGDLLRALDRYIRLEAEVLLPVLARTGFDPSDAHRRHSDLNDLIARAGAQGDAADTLPALRAAFDAHARTQRERVFPVADKLADAEQEALAYELDEVRNRMRGAYGV